MRELGLATLLSGHVPEGQLLGGLVVYAALSHWLPLIASAFFAGHELWRGIFRGGERKAAEGHVGRPIASPARRRTPTVL